MAVLTRFLSLRSWRCLRPSCSIWACYTVTVHVPSPKKGDNLGFNGHKHHKGDKVVPICDRNCNIISPFVVAPSNRNEVVLFRPALTKLVEMAKKIWIKLAGMWLALMEFIIIAKIVRQSLIRVWLQISLKTKGIVSYPSVAGSRFMMPKYSQKDFEP